MTHMRTIHDGEMDNQQEGNLKVEYGSNKVLWRAERYLKQNSATINHY